MAAFFLNQNALISCNLKPATPKIKTLRVYISSIREHTIQCICDLNDLRNLSLERELSAFEYLALQRLLHVLIEAAIGYAKQWVRREGHPIPNDAYLSFQKLHDLSFITEKELQSWKKVIGLRNLLVHDYLNIDRTTLLDLLKNQRYQFIADFLLKS